MLYLLLGEDGWSKQAYLEQLAKKLGLVVNRLPQPPERIEELVGVDLFGQPQILAVAEAWAGFNQPESLERLIASKNHVAFLEKKLDKRLAATKQLLADRRVDTREFFAPRGAELISWITNRAQALGGRISQAAAQALAVAIGQDQAPGFGRDAGAAADLWLADSELSKLAAFAQGREITEQDVRELCPEYREVEVFELTNAMADADRAKALKLIERYFQETSGGAKEPAILLNAVLAEQFRSALAVKDLLARRQPDAQILALTGWKSGRLFVMKKMAARFSQEKIMDLLGKFQALDAELKSAQTPPKVLFSLILSQF